MRNGAVIRYPGSYADYVYHLEHEVRRELTAEGSAPSGGTPTADAPSAYRRRKQRISAQRKLTGQIARSEERQRSDRTEKEALEDEMAANPAICTRELAHRLDELARQLRDEERRWMHLTEQLESLPGA